MSVTRTGSLIKALERIQSLHGTTVSYGLMGELGEEPGPPGGPSLPLIGFWLHYGTRRMRARPFLAVPLAEHGPQWAQALRKAARQMLAADPIGAHTTIRRLGVVGVGQIQSLIVGYGWAPNAPWTIAAKGSDRPLIDTGRLRQSIRASVDVPGRPPELIG